MRKDELTSYLTSLIGKSTGELATLFGDTDLCWGLVKHAYLLLGIKLPKSIMEVKGDFKVIKPPYQPTDVIVFRVPEGIRETFHLAIVLRETETGGIEFIHAEECANGVQKCSLDRLPWKDYKRYIVRHDSQS